MSVPFLLHFFHKLWNFYGIFNFDFSKKVKIWKVFYLIISCINRVAFPGIFRGALDARAREINEEMKKAAAYAIASLISDKELCAEYIIPKAFDERVGKAVAKAVYDAAVRTGASKRENL